MIKIAIVDDHTIFRAGLKALLVNKPDVSIVLECSDGSEFLQQMHASIDMVLMDLDMPGMNGMQTMEALYQQKSEIPVIFVSSNHESSLISSLMELGARGYVHKEADEKELFDAIYSVQESGYYFNDLVSRSMLMKLATKEQIKPTFNYGEMLSDRETEILQLICEEHTTSEIGEKLFISPKTVENHRSRIMDKTGSRNTAGLVVYAIKNKLIDVG